MSPAPHRREDGCQDDRKDKERTLSAMFGIMVEIPGLRLEHW